MCSMYSITGRNSFYLTFPDCVVIPDTKKGMHNGESIVFPEKVAS